MSIIYNLKINNTSEVDGFPPSVLASDWFTNLLNYLNENKVSINNGFCLVFNDETALNNWLSAHRLTDPTLLNDIAQWKSFHGISYANEFYRSADSGSFSPGVLD